jgi:hypothetical protein
MRRYFIAGLIFGAGAVAGAASGDIIYDDNRPTVVITGAQAACYADCAIANGSWNGVRTDLVAACAFRDPTSSTGFYATTKGRKTAAPSAVPLGSVVVDRVP